MADQRVITLYQGDGTPKDIVLRELPVATPSAGTTIYLYAGDATPKDVVLRDPTAAPVSGGSDLDFDIDTAGAITIAGQAVTASVSQSLTNGALAIAGQTVTAGIGQSLGAGAVTLAGQSLSAGIGIEIGVGYEYLIDEYGDYIVDESGNWIIIDGSGFGGPDIEGGELTPSVSQAIGNGALSLTGSDLTASFAVSLDAGAIVLAGGDVTASTSGAAPVTDTIGGGGWRWDSEYDRYLDRKRKKRKREIELAEAEEAAQQLDAVESEIARLLHEQEKKDLERAESERLLRMARRYADSVEIADKLREAMAKAAALETFGALEALKRELERTAEEEEVALLLILNQ